MKTIFVNSDEKTMRGVKQYAFGVLNSMNARRVPMDHISFKMINGRYFFIKTAQLEIFVFPAGTNMTGYHGMADEAFYFPKKDAEYLYGDRYSERYGRWLIDYIVEVEGGLGRPENDGKGFIHEYDL